MKIWLSKNSEIPVREQLITQISLGIISGDLAINSRLPSTNEIALRFGVHPNTVSSAYRNLVGQGFVEFKKGSGYYVCDNRKHPLKGELKLDELVADFFRHAQSEGYSINEIQKALRKRLAFAPPDKLILVESDADLREILIFELEEGLKRQIQAVSFQDFAEKYYREKALFLALSDEKPKIETVLPAAENCIYLKARSVAESMKGSQRPSADDLIAVVSGWGTFLSLAKTMLVAAKIEPDSLIVRLTREPNWRHGLSSASMIICDSLTGKKLARYQNVRKFCLIANESFDEIAKNRTEN
ncbi:hypothetical protein BH10ACI1_BH10ACI1_06950 [soil metagenome]